MSKTDEVRTRVLTHLIYRFSDGISAAELKKEYEKWSDDMNIVGLNLGRYLENAKVLTLTHSGIVVYYPSEKVEIPGHISDLGPSSKIHDMFIISFFDVHSFVAGFVQADITAFQAYLKQLQSDCEVSEVEEKLRGPTPAMLWPGDCYVAKLNENWIRVKVTSRTFTEGAATCFLLDHGDYRDFTCDALQIPPDDFVEKEDVFLIPKRFKKASHVVRCYFDGSSDFPKSLTGLRYAICQKKKLKRTKIKVRFLSYNSEYDSYRIQLFGADEDEDLFSEALREIPRLLELDRHFEMEEKDRIDSTEDEFIANVDTFLGNTSPAD